MKKRGIVLMNLGSPASPATGDVRRYLREFLMDERVIDMPYLSRLLLVNLIIAPFRAPKSARLYKGIWTEEGSPLITHSNNLRDRLQEAFDDYMIVTAMRYGQPSTSDALRQLEAAGVSDVLLLPMYPHFAMSSYETAVAEAMHSYYKNKHTFLIKTVRPYYNDEQFLHALSESIRPYLNDDYDHVLFSYHGIPERHIRKSDTTGHHCLQSPDCCTTHSEAHNTCYRHQCFYTTKKVAAELRLAEGSFSSSFQSRLGSDPWLQPYTAELLPKLPDKGIRKLIVICPAFSADCLETLEEMDVEGRQLFLDAGGTSFTRVPCLNTNALWVETICSWIQHISAGNHEMIA